MPVSLGTIDAGGDGKVVLMTSLNHKLGTQYSLDDFEFETPEVVKIPNPTHNTVIKFGPKAHTGYYGLKRLYYNRIHVSELGVIRVEKGAATKVSQLLQKVNDKYGILITEQDIFDAAIPPLPPGETEVEVSFDFRPTSIVFYGGTKVILGSNDPAVLDPNSVKLAFEPTWMFFAEDIRKGQLNSYAISIDQDKARKRVSPTLLIPDTPDISLFYQRQIDSSEANHYLGHMVGAYKASNGKVTYGLNLYGQILQRNEQATKWEKVGELETVDLTQADVVNQYQTNKPYLFVMQDHEAHSYVLKADTDSWKLFQSVDGLQFNTSTLSTSTHLSLDKYKQGKLEILDRMVIEKTLYLLVFDKDETEAQLSVVSIDLTNQQVSSYRLDNQNLLYTESLLKVTKDKHVKASFVSQPHNSGVPSVAILAGLGTSHEANVIWAVWNQTQYELQSTKALSLYPEQDKYQGSFISSYSLNLQKDTDLYLDVIEVGTMIASDRPDFELFKDMGMVKAAKSFYTHGVQVLTRTRKGLETSHWQSKAVTLGVGAYPQRLIFFDLNKRAHYVMQAESGIYRLTFTEDNQISGFVPAYTENSVMGLEGHTGFNQHSNYGYGLVDKPTITETANTQYGMSVYTDTESQLPALNYSFIAKDNEGKIHWFNAKDTNSLLTERVLGKENQHIGTTPQVVFSDGTSIYALMPQQTNVYKYTKSNQKWSVYGSLAIWAKAANHEHGYSPATLNANSIKALHYKSDEQKLMLQYSLNTEIDTLNTSGSSLVQTKSIEDQGFVIITDDASATYADSMKYKKVDQITSYGINLLDSEHPRKLEHISYRSDGQPLYKAKVTNSADYDTELTNIQIPDQFPSDLTILSARTDVDYLNLKGIYYAKTDQEVYKLVFHGKNDQYTELGLFGTQQAGLTQFKPEVVFSLYEHASNDYVPLVYYGNKQAILMDKVTFGGTFQKKVFNLTIPSDNGSPLVPIPVLTANRGEYLFVQKGNGVFQLNYTFEETSQKASLNLLRLFSFTGSMVEMDFVSACIASWSLGVHPTELTIPVPKPHGTLIKEYCDKTTKMGQYADGNNGYYYEVIEVNSASCGYVAPPPGTLSADAVTLTAALAAADSTGIKASTIQKHENDTAYVTYSLANALQDNVSLDAAIEYTGAQPEDIEEMKLTMGDGSPEDFTFPGTIEIPAGTTQFKLSFKFKADNQPEDTETFKVTLTKSQGNTSISNHDPIEVIFTVLDTTSP